MNKARAAQFSRAEPNKCFICGDPIGERCFCKIHRKEAEPIVLCCPDCLLQYYEAKEDHADIREQELKRYEDSFLLFGAQKNSWS